MENGHRRHRRNSITPELSELVAACAVDVDKAVHVADAEALDWRLGVLLPLGAKTETFSR